MKKFILTLVMFWLTACSTPKVHLIHHGVEDNRLAHISQKLTELGYEVIHSNAIMPEQFDHVSIASNPGITDNRLFADVEGVLSAMGWTMPTYYKFAQGNHFYNEGHIGLYLRNPLVRTMPPIMGSRRCRSLSATLEYFKNNQAIFEYDTFDKAKAEYKTIQIKGRYRAIKNDLTLFFDGQPEIQLAVGTDMVDTYAGLKRADYIELPLKHFVDSEEICRFDAVYE